jgi:predicted Zn-dependent peptidase
VEVYFADIEPQPQPVHPDLTEPSADGSRWEIWRDSLARVPGVIVGWPGPARRSRDFCALNVLDMLLTAGDSSRFQQNLVKGRKSVIQYEANLGWPFASSTDYKDPGMYAMFALYNPAFTSAQIVGQFEEEIELVNQQGITPEELERTRTLLRSSRYREIQSSHSRAALLAKYELLDGDANYLNTELGDFLSVTAEEVLDAARRYLVADRRTVLEILPAATEEVQTA